MATPAPPQAELFAKLDSQIQSGQRKKALRTVDEGDQNDDFRTLSILDHFAGH